MVNDVGHFVKVFADGSVVSMQQILTGDERQKVVDKIIEKAINAILHVNGMNRNDARALVEQELVPTLKEIAFAAGSPD